MHRDNLEEMGSNFSRGEGLVSNGAYTLKEWKPRVYIELEKNPNYREAENVIVESVAYVPIEDLTTEVMAFRTGEIHWTNEVPNNQFR